MEGQSIKSSETRSYLASHQREEPTAFWRSSLHSGVNFFKASFTAAHVFSRHTHDEYAIAVVERGAPTFTCRGAGRVAPTGSFLLINPDEPHEGRSANDRSYRMMYSSRTRCHGCSTPTAQVCDPIIFHSSVRPSSKTQAWLPST
jgi:hypothetical protein